MRFDESNLQKDRNNFDLLRLLAACMVLVGHAPIVWNKQHFSFDPIYEVFHHHMHAFGVVVFFIISGFLVTRSYGQRSKPIPYLKARMLRIFPGVTASVVLCVFVLGPVFTNLEMAQYFAAPETWKYLANATLFRITYVLPGVFEHHTIGNSINASLWSLSYEFFCYLLVLLIGLSGMFRKWISLGLFAILLGIYLFAEPLLTGMEIPVWRIKIDVLMPYLLYFISGGLVYQFREAIPWKWWFCLIAFMVGFSLPHLGLTDKLQVFTLPYVVLYLALRTPKIWKGYHQVGDLSYGVFLYAFPVQQILIQIFPSISLVGYIALTLICVLPIAWLSWHLIEKRFLAWK